MEKTEAVEKVVLDLRGSKKYKFLAEDTIRDVVTLELQKHKSVKNAVKAARKRLHLILASYLSEINPAAAGQLLDDVFSSGDGEKIKQACLDIMGKHASTRERLPILADFYQRIFQVTGIPRTVADLACAMNPFSYRWMNLPPETAYYAYDNNQQTVALLDTYFQLEKLTTPPEERDVLCNPPQEDFDVVFLFKMYHCLEHRQKGAGLEVLKNIRARWLAVSFPTQNLVGRRSDIFGNYKNALEEYTRDRARDSHILEFDTELVLIIDQTNGP